MSKKNRLKKKKKLKLQKKIEDFTPEVGQDTEIEVEDKIVPGSQKTAKPEEESSIIDVPTRKLISKDVKLIIITLSFLALLLVTVRILQEKTEIINTFGDWLYKITNIQTM